MASYQWRTNGDGTRKVTALVRVRGLKPASRSFDEIADARRWAEKVERELKDARRRGTAAPDVAQVTLRDLCQRYLDDDGVKALRSYESIMPLVEWWIGEFGPTKMLSFGTATVLEARRRLAGGRAPGTVNRRIAAMRRVFSWGRLSGLVAEDRAWPVGVMLKEPRGRTRYLSDAEIARLFAVLQDEPAWMRAAVVVALGTGMRQGELLRLRWRDVDLARGQAVIHQTKTDRPRAVHLTPVVVEALSGLSGEPDDRIVPLGKEGLIARWHRVRKLAGLRDYRWHDHRHSAASFLASGGASLLEIGSVLGHRSPASTFRYSHLVEAKPVAAHGALDSKLRAKR